MASTVVPTKQPKQHRNALVKICSVNLKHHFLSNKALADYINNNRIDLCLIQEPYCTQTGNMIVFSKNQIYRKSSENADSLSVIAVSDTFQQYVEPVLSPCTDTFVAVKILTIKAPVYLISIYSNPKNPDLLKQNLDWAHQIIRKAQTTNSPVVIAGDFNAHSRVWWETHEDQNGAELVKWMSANLLHLHNDRTKTFHGPQGDSLIDLTFSNFAAQSKVINWRIDQTSLLSDHWMQRFDLNIGTGLVKKGIFHRSTWKWSETHQNENWEGFAGSVDNTTLQQLLNRPSPSTKTELNGHVHTIIQVLTAAANKALKPGKGPYEKAKYKNGKLMPWWDEELTTLLRDVRWAEDRYKRCTGKTDGSRQIKEFRKGIFKNIKKEFRRLSSDKEFQHWKSFLAEIEQASPYGNAYRLITAKLNKTNSFAYLDNLPPNDRGPALNQMLHHHFADDDPEDDTPAAAQMRANAQKMILEQNFSNSEGIVRVATMPELEQIIGSLGDKKAPGLDHISSKMIKNAGPLAKQVLLNTINGCLKAEFFPDEWKVGEAIFIPKGDGRDPKMASSFRPITLLPIPGKIFERILKYRIEEHADMGGEDLLGKDQFGFTRGRSTIDALKQIQEAIMNKHKLDRVIMLSLDIKSAFDNAWWPAILHTMNKLNFPKGLINLTVSYFQNRSIKSTYGRHSAQKRLSKGAPQGSAISPTYWLIVLSDLLLKLDLASIPKLVVTTFADDVSLVAAHRNIESLLSLVQDILDRIQQWCRDHKLELSAEKTKIMPLYRLCPPDNRTITDREGNKKEMAYVDSVKILGVHFQKSMGPSVHIEKTVAKVIPLKNRLFLYNHNLWGLSSEKRIRIVKTVIIPMLSYGCEVWFKERMLKQKTTLQRLSSLQHQSLRNAVCGYKTISTIACETLTRTPYIGFHLFEKQNVYELMRKPPNETKHPILQCLSEARPERGTVVCRVPFSDITMPINTKRARSYEDSEASESDEEWQAEEADLSPPEQDEPFMITRIVDGMPTRVVEEPEPSLASTHTSSPPIAPTVRVVDLTPEKESAIRRERRMREERDREKEEEKRKEVSHDEWLEQIHPIHVPESPDEIQIHTYGCFNKQSSGSAFLVHGHDNKPTSFRFPSYVLRAQSEQFAIMKALKRIRTDQKELRLFENKTTINMITTQPTILSKLAKIDKLLPLEVTIAKYFHKLKMQVKMTVPHRLNTTTKLIRKSAKQCAEDVGQPFSEYEKYTTSTVKMLARRVTNTLMDERFDEKASEVLKEFFIKWTQVPRYLKITYDVSQLATGHGAINSNLARFNVRDQYGNAFGELCWCDQKSVQSVRHVLLDCPEFADIHSEGFVGNTGQFTATFTSLHQYISSQPQCERFAEQATVVMDRLRQRRAQLPPPPTPIPPDAVPQPSQQQTTTQ